MPASHWCKMSGATGGLQTKAGLASGVHLGHCHPVLQMPPSSTTTRPCPLPILAPRKVDLPNRQRPLRVLCWAPFSSDCSQFSFFFGLLRNDMLKRFRLFSSASARNNKTTSRQRISVLCQRSPIPSEDPQCSSDSTACIPPYRWPLQSWSPCGASPQAHCFNMLMPSWLQHSTHCSHAPWPHLHNLQIPSQFLFSKFAVWLQQNSSDEKSPERMLCAWGVPSVYLLEKPPMGPGLHLEELINSNAAPAMWIPSLAQSYMFGLPCHTFEASAQYRSDHEELDRLLTIRPGIPFSCVPIKWHMDQILMGHINILIRAPAIGGCVQHSMEMHPASTSLCH